MARTVAPDVGSSPAAGYFAMLADNDVRVTALHQLIGIEKRDALSRSPCGSKVYRPR
jgi:hypothetical protein